MSDFRFIDLFAGIGGFRLGFEAAGGKCVFTSEINEHARKTYAVNHGVEEASIAGDIAEVDPADIPDHDLLLAGFPCQAFSIGGRKKGFEDTRGTLFFEIERILKQGKTPAFVLENVPHLTKHDGGKTFRIITKHLRELGYHLSFQVINAAAWVPQNRKRIFICGHINNPKFEIDFMPVPDPASGPRLGSILEPEPPLEAYLSDARWEFHKERQKEGQSYSLFHANDVGNTLISRYDGTGGEARLLIDSDPFEQVRLSDKGLAAVKKNAKERGFKVHILGKDDVGNTLVANYRGGMGASALLVAGDLEDCTLSSGTWAALQRHKEKHAAEGNGFGYTVADPDGKARTLSARYGKDGSEILIERPKRNPRRLTPRECARLMGFPDDFQIPVSKTQAYRLFGNAVVPQVCAHIAHYLKPNIGAER